MSTRVRLSIMMFLQYAVWGLWLPVIGRYLETAGDAGGLGFSKAQVGWILGLGGSIGAICSPFIAGQLADRHFRTERFLSFLLLVGGLIILIALGTVSRDMERARAASGPAGS